MAVNTLKATELTRSPNIMIKNIDNKTAEETSPEDLKIHFHKYLKKTFLIRGTSDMCTHQTITQYPTNTNMVSKFHNRFQVHSHKGFTRKNP